VSRPRWQLRDAAVGYASRGIPVLPLHYPLPHRTGLQPVLRDQQRETKPGGCSCRDPGCGQVTKHPLGSLVPHGVKDATCNRARILAWWTRHPQANIGLATGHRFDVLDVDGPTGAQAIRELAATHGFQSSGPLVRTGGGGWHFYLAPIGLGNAHPRDLEHVDWRGRGGYVVAPPSRHASGHPYQWAPGRDLDTPLGQVPTVLLERLQPRHLQRATNPIQLPAAADGPGERYARAALAEELALVATAPHGQRNQQLWESTRNLYNLVAAGALDHRQVHQGLLQAAERCGLLAEEPRQTHRTVASGRQVGLAHPRPAPYGTRLDPTHASPPPPARAGGERIQEGGDGDGRRRPADRLTVSHGVGACRRQAEPAPTHHPTEEEPPVWAAIQP
jgi:Bifunctional DNA primase/polymerase, N-terminal